MFMKKTNVSASNSSRPQTPKTKSHTTTTATAKKSDSLKKDSKIVGKK